MYSLLSSIVKSFKSTECLKLTKYGHCFKLNKVSRGEQGTATNARFTKNNEYSIDNHVRFQGLKRTESPKIKQSGFHKDTPILVLGKRYEICDCHSYGCYRQCNVNT